MPGAGESQNDVAAAYDRWAATYDSDANATRDLDALVLRRSGLELRDRRVLELGAGTGKNTEWIAAHAAHVTALDFSAAMLARARLRVSGANVEFVRHDVRERWPLGNASADVVISNLILEHVRDLSFVFAETARVLRPRGAAYFAELHPARQMRGGQAQFTEHGQRVLVAAYVHSVSEYVNAAIAAGLRIAALEEPIEDGAPEGAPPRLLVLRVTA
jgi:ubiquinone/menaquinone biosynthesis C-methylase UbiE